MPKEKYDPPDPRRCYTIMSAEEAASGKKSHWAELEISGGFTCSGVRGRIYEEVLRGKFVPKPGADMFQKKRKTFWNSFY